MRRVEKLRTTRSKPSWRLSALATVLLASFSALSASAAEDEARLWLSGTTRVALPGDFEASLLLQTRFSDDIEEFERVLIQPWLGRKLGSGFSAATGYDAHVIRDPRDQIEHRVWQQLGFGHVAFFARALHRLRLEERFLERIDGAAVRIRYMLRGSAAIASSKWRAVLSDELFFGLNSKTGGPQSGFGETRFFAGLERPLSESLTLQAGYQLQYVDRRPRDAANHTLLMSFAYAP